MYRRFFRDFKIAFLVTLHLIPCAVARSLSSISLAFVTESFGRRYRDIREVY